MAVISLRWRRSASELLCIRLFALAGWWCLAAAAEGGKEDMVEGQINLMWPIHFSSMPLSTPDKSSLETPDFGRELAKIGLERFIKYRDTTLPKELEIDKRYAEEFAQAEHSRINNAFLRWQKQVFSQRTGIHPMELTGRGDPAPRLKGIDYTWPEFYDDPIYKKLHHRISQVSRLYLKRTGYEDLPRKLRIFTWVEVFAKGDAMRPWARTDGAFMMGRYFAQAEKGGLKFNFEDPRGVNPPYGKTYSHFAFEGNLIMFPTWLSHFITPNMLNSSQVCFGFLVYPPDGNTLDWEDDQTGGLEVKRQVHVGRKGQAYLLND